MTIIVASMHYDEIKEQLIAQGFTEGQHFYRGMEKSKPAQPPKLPQPVQQVNSRDYTVQHSYRNTVIGRYTYGYEVLCDANEYIKEIGSFCSINKTAYAGANHPVNKITSSPFFYSPNTRKWFWGNYVGFMDPEDMPNFHEIAKNSPITIGHDVWIAAHAVILSSVKIGNGAIIAAGAVVTKDVPDYAIVAGVPAKVIKYRFSPEEIKMLQEIKWWDWPIEEIKANAPLFMNNVKFFQKFYHQLSVQNGGE
ncbi:CatB-related O-acetyltransferase [Paenibacillus sp. PAMC21692]|nr:CatB-related O-acetyltransferase [Paenibacillus sp. PAMC21692]